MIEMSGGCCRHVNSGLRKRQRAGERRIRSPQGALPYHKNVPPSRLKFTLVFGIPLFVPTNLCFPKFAPGGRQCLTCPQERYHILC